MAGADTGQRVPVEVSRECLNQGISVNSHRCRKVRGRRSRPSELGKSHNQFGVDPHPLPECLVGERDALDGVGT